MSKKGADLIDPSKLVESISDLLKKAVEQDKGNEALQAAQRHLGRYRTIEDLQVHVDNLTMDKSNLITLQRTFNDLHDITTPRKVHKNKYAHLAGSTPEYAPEEP